MPALKAQNAISSIVSVGKVRPSGHIRTIKGFFRPSLVYALLIQKAGEDNNHFELSNFQKHARLWNGFRRKHKETGQEPPQI